MSETAEVVYAHHTAEHLPGDRETLSLDDARRLVEAGMANYATVTAAKAAGDPEPTEHAATRKKG